jgi:hypothetical protein
MGINFKSEQNSKMEQISKMEQNLSKFQTEKIQIETISN